MTTGRPVTCEARVVNPTASIAPGARGSVVGPSARVRPARATELIGAGRRAEALVAGQVGGSTRNFRPACRKLPQKASELRTSLSGRAVLVASIHATGEGGYHREARLLGASTAWVLLTTSEEHVMSATLMDGRSLGQQLLGVTAARAADFHRKHGRPPDRRSPGTRCASAAAASSPPPGSPEVSRPTLRRVLMRIDF